MTTRLAAGIATQRSYENWRATVPFSNEQIADALVKHFAQVFHANTYTDRRGSDAIAWVRAGHLSSRLLGLALPHLVTACGICGKTELYRWGNEGRCRTHREIKSASKVKATAIREALESEKRADLAEAEDRLRQIDAMRRFKATRPGSGWRGHR